VQDKPIEGAKAGQQSMMLLGRAVKPPLPAGCDRPSPRRGACGPWRAGTAEPSRAWPWRPTGAAWRPAARTAPSPSGRSESVAEDPARDAPPGRRRRPRPVGAPSWLGRRSLAWHARRAEDAALRGARAGAVGAGAGVSEAALALGLGEALARRAIPARWPWRLGLDRRRRWHLGLGRPRRRRLGLDRRRRWRLGLGRGRRRRASARHEPEAHEGGQERSHGERLAQLEVQRSGCRAVRRDILRTRELLLAQLEHRTGALPAAFRRSPAPRPSAPAARLADPPGNRSESLGPRTCSVL